MSDTTEVGIYGALAKAQAEMGRAAKDASNPHFNKKYADLASVQDACLPALHKHGFAVFQPVERTEQGLAVRTILAHESGETLDCSVPLVNFRNDMQGLGSAITYARRYGLLCMSGVAPEDDDGNAAVRQQTSDRKFKGCHDPAARMHDVTGWAESETTPESSPDVNADFANEPAPQLPQHDDETVFRTRIDGALSTQGLAMVWADMVAHYGSAEAVPPVMRDRVNKRKKSITDQDAREMA